MGDTDVVIPPPPLPPPSQMLPLSATPVMQVMAVVAIVAAVVGVVGEVGGGVPPQFCCCCCCCGGARSTGVFFERLAAAGARKGLGKQQLLSCLSVASDCCARVCVLEGRGCSGGWVVMVGCVSQKVPPSLARSLIFFFSFLPFLYSTSALLFFVLLGLPRAEVRACIQHGCT